MPVVLSLPSSMKPKYSSTILTTSQMPAKKMLAPLSMFLSARIFVLLFFRYINASATAVTVAAGKYCNWKAFEDKKLYFERELQITVAKHILPEGTSNVAASPDTIRTSYEARGFRALPGEDNIRTPGNRCAPELNPCS